MLNTASSVAINTVHSLRFFQSDLSFLVLNFRWPLSTFSRVVILKFLIIRVTCFKLLTLILIWNFPFITRMYSSASLVSVKYEGFLYWIEDDKDIGNKRQSSNILQSRHLSGARHTLPKLRKSRMIDQSLRDPWCVVRFSKYVMCGEHFLFTPFSSTWLSSWQVGKLLNDQVV